jgi:serine/threonine protein kinase
MKQEELSRIRENYEQAVPMSGPAREAYLNRECHDEEETREEVERLLKARESIPAWLDRPAVGMALPFAAPTLPKMEGRRFNGYTLVREIGRGGMGSVYLAERSDDTFHRQAAIKLLLPAGNSAAVVARFQQEREILASLDHPNIAQLLDAGVTEEGWPYFVMEFVDGQPIHRWCDERKLNVSQRVVLFRGVIDAVRYAHQRLVVHRDLKPSNILVTNDGVVKLLDFGIAKVLSGAASGKAPDTLTLAGMMTPEYASPEQVNGTPITTMSDVYSLGVILYELLTGHRPYRLLSTAVHEMARVISEAEPTRPSEVVTTTETASGRDGTQITPETVSAVREGEPNRLRKRLTGDLDSILLMALHKKAEGRYGSAESFAQDLQRHLEHRPVHAREASFWERFRRSCQRNPGTVAAGVLLAISFLGSGLAVVAQARHDIEAAVRDPNHQVLMLPVLLFFATAIVVGLAAFVYIFRPTKAKLMAAAGGGIVWGVCIMGKWWLEGYLGWWRSRLPGVTDPLEVLALGTLAMYCLGATAILLILSMIGRRFGWKGQALTLVGIGLFQAPRERVWYGTIIPLLTFEPGVVPVLCGAAMLAIGGGLAARG